MSKLAWNARLEAEMDALFGGHTAAGMSPGLVYGLAGKEGLVHSAGFGVANDDGLAPGAGTLFPIASMSKSFVAAAALVARDEGYLSFGDPVTRYVPELVVSNDELGVDGAPNLEMLLSMCGGLTEDNAWVDPFIGMPTGALLDRIAKGVRLSHHPGAEFEYSNLGYALAGIAISRAVGCPLEAFVRDALLGPLGLESTNFGKGLGEGVAPALGYHRGASGQWVPFAPQQADAFAAAGGMLSTVEDLATWVTWLGSAFRQPRSGDVGVLSRASRRELQRVHVLMPPALSILPDGAIRAAVSGYGLGVVASSDLRHGVIVSHAGSLPGFKCFMGWHPVSGNAAVVLTNSSEGDPAALCREALGRVLRASGAPASTARLWPETLALRSDVDRLVRSWDDNLASRVLARNVDFDRPVSERRAEIQRMVAEVGPLKDPGEQPRIVSAVTPAEVTWSIPGDNGELVCMIHLTPVCPPQVQELVVRSYPASRPRAAIPTELAPRRCSLGEAFISPVTNVAVELPPGWTPSR